MTDMTVDPKHKVDVREHDIVISTLQSVIILCRKCGNTRNVSLHELPTINEPGTESVIRTGTVQYPAFKYCRCGEAVAPNSGGGTYKLNEVYHAVEKCQTVDEALRMISYFMRYESGEQKEKTA
jgi:hypothetical protein